MLSKGKRSNVSQSHGAMGANERHYYFALYGHSNFVAEVLKITPALLCSQNKKNETALHIAVNEGHAEVVRVLLACVEDHNTKEKLTRMTDASGDTALHKAVQSQHLDVVKLLVKEDSEFEFPPNHAQETPLYLAAESGFHDALIIMNAPVPLGSYLQLCICISE
ncbi:hypothetical protein BC332_14383 [Capsicum chinense]|nr:hypothetical protein BC332_14383 [Capsicum chinense]